MIAEGQYLYLWLKYADVIRVLLKKTDTENQKLQLYKHEFEQGGRHPGANISFSLDLINGKALNIVSSTGIARDLWQVLYSDAASKNLLKDRKIKISIGKTFELQFEKIQEN